MRQEQLWPTNPTTELYTYIHVVMSCMSYAHPVILFPSFNLYLYCADRATA